MSIVHYDSLGAFEKSLPWTVRGNSDRDHSPRDFNGYQTYAEAKANIWRGDSKALEESEKLLDQIESDGIELAQDHWVHAPAGFVPCIPSYLAGSPESMRRLEAQASESAPVKIYYDVCLSGGFTSKALMQRGVAVLALVRKLQSLRPTELWLFASLHGKKRDATGDCAIPVIRLDTNPLDLTTASYVLANPGFLRQVCFGWGEQYGFNGRWAWHGNPGMNRAKLAEFLEIADSDLLIDGASVLETDMRDPLAWVNSQVSKYTLNIDLA